MPNRVSIDWRAIDLNTDMNAAVLIAHQVAKEVRGTYELQYVEYEDCGDYPCGHDGPYEAWFMTDDWQYYGHAYGASPASALLKAVREHLMLREMRPLWLEEDLRLVSELPGDTARAAIRKALSQPQPHNLVHTLREAAGLPKREADDD